MSFIRIGNFTYSNNISLEDIHETIAELLYAHTEEYDVNEDEIEELLNGEEIETDNYPEVEKLISDLSIQHSNTVFSYITYVYKNDCYFKVYFKNGKNYSVEGKLVFEDFDIEMIM